MSYNGVGLTTPRGSGTNGYVQRNRSYVPPSRKAQYMVDYKPPPTTKKPNKEIIEHERRRQVEVQVLTLEQELQARGVSDGEISTKVEAFREKLMQKFRDGKMIVDPKELSETHEISAAKEKEMERIRIAFGVSEEHKEGEVFEKMGYEEDRLDRAKKKRRREKRKRKGSRQTESTTKLVASFDLDGVWQWQRQR